MKQTILSARELANHLGGEVLGDDSVQLRGLALAIDAKPGDATFAESSTYLASAEVSAATAIIVGPDAAASSSHTLIRVPNVRIAFAKALELWHPEEQPAPGIHASAVVADTATVDPSAHVGPLCVIGEGVTIGARSALVGGVHVGEHCSIGEGCRLFPNVTLYANTQVMNRVSIHAGAVIGSDGYGYVLDDGRHRKIPQVGNVILHDDVEIGANVTIDRGAIGPTTVGRGAKIDNLVQLGHNVSIGDHSLLISQVGVAGSTKVGRYAVLAGQVGVAGHLKIGDKTTLAAKSGVMNDIPDGETWMGIPATPIKDAKRQMLAARKSWTTQQRVQSLEKEVERLRRLLESQASIPSVLENEKT